MKLSVLHGEFFLARANGNYVRTDAIAQSHGVIFLCPLCFAANGGNEGTHSILIPFADRGVPAEFCPKLPRWTFVSGTSLDTLTITPSILIHAPCGWHGFITNGDAA